MERTPIHDGKVVGGSIEDVDPRDDEDIVMTEYAERPVVDKKVVETEHVSLDKQQVGGTARVNADVSREEVDVVESERGERIHEDRDFVDGDRDLRTDEYREDHRSLGEKAKDIVDGDRDGDGHLRDNR